MDNKKREYKKIIRDSLIRKGYMKKPSFKERLDEIILESFEDLDLLIDEKCQPDYIQSLPGSLRSTDPKELQTRLDAIDERLEEVEKEMKSDLRQIEIKENEIEDAIEKRDKIQEALDEYNKKLEDFAKNDEESQGEAIDESMDIIRRWDKVVDDAERLENVGTDVGEPQTPVMPKVEGVYNLNTLMRMFGVDEFEFKGYLTSEEVQFIKTLAENVGEYAYSGSNNGQGNAWSTEVSLLADDMIDFADKYDINKNDVGDDLVDLTGVTSVRNPTEWAKQIDYINNDMLPNNEGFLADYKTSYAKHETEYNDLSENRDKTEAKLNEAKKNQ